MEINYFNPTYPQQVFRQKLYSGVKILCINAGRQVGKTYWINMEAHTYALNNPRSKIFIVSPTDEQNDKFIEEIDNLFEGREELRDGIYKSINRTKKIFKFKNGSIIKLRSLESGNSLRGGTANLVFVDEAAFSDLETFTSIITPYITRTNGQIVSASTSNGTNWWYKNLFLEGKKPENKGKIETVQFDYTSLKDEPDYDSILMTIDLFRKTMPRKVFDREIMNAFITDDGIFDNIRESFKDTKPHKKGENLYMGADIGIANDYTVLFIMDEKYRLVDWDRFNVRNNNLTPTRYKDRIANFYHKWEEDLVIGYFEVNNKELLYEELIYDYHLEKLFDFTVTGKNKTELINNLAKLFEEQRLSLPINIGLEWLESELYDYKGKKNKITGTMVYSNGSSDGHDDGVMCLAHVTNCIRLEAFGGVTTFS